MRICGKKSSGNVTLPKLPAPQRRSAIVPFPVPHDDGSNSELPINSKEESDEDLIREAIERNDFLNKIISGKRLDDVINAMYNKEISAKDTVIKQGEKGSHMYISAKGTYQILIKNKVVNEFSDVRVFGELALLYNAKRLATIKALTPGRVWVLDRNVYQQITVGYNIKKQDEIMQFLMNNERLKVVGKEALQEVSGLLKSEFFKAGTQIVRQGDKGNKFYIISAGTVTITKDGEGVVGVYKKGDCFGELALLKEDCRQATVTADAPGVECLTLTRKQFVDHFGDIKEWEYINVRPQDSFKDGVTEHEDIDLRDLKIIKTLGVGGFGRVELVQHKKKSDLVFALKYLKKIDIVMQHQQEHVYNEKNIQMACKSPFIVRLYRTYKDNKYIYLLMESCLGGDLWSLLQKQKLRRFDEKEARFIAACVLESFDYLHSRGIIYRDLKPENLLIAANGYIKLTDFGFAKKISSRGKTFTFAGTPEYVAPEIVLNRGHDRSVDYWAFGAFIFELLTGRTPFRTDDSSHMKTYNKILSGIDNVPFPSYVNLKARHIVEKLCRPVPSERLGMQKPGIKSIKDHKWFLGFDWLKFAKCEMPSPFKPKLKSPIDTQYFDPFKKDNDIPPDELSGWDTQF
ncbi:cGMP-dependent protein kinase, isozyme 1 isoform X3 [Anoplophora glabripennis]|uniref:cGMP-dependent protein kinase, isozyme 1 isoform X3 n=1 Tax=Anoplophora glabripennis TaxID=217634 RepID=UPI000874303B|nr:cGMP-dependent protein kinase, isozyme 1 isoform X3 [Anoplophora glabripennis]